MSDRDGKNYHELLRAVRNADGAGPLTVYEVAARADVPVTPRLLWLAEPLLPPQQPGFLCPPDLTEFIVALLEQEENAPGEIADPWVGAGTLLGPVVDQMRPKRAVGLGPSQHVELAGRMVSTLESVEFGDLQTSDNGDRFDAIISILPFGISCEPFEFCGEPYRSERYRRLFWSCHRLAPDGVGIFVAPVSVFFKSGTPIHETLSKTGVRLDAAFFIPPATFGSIPIRSCALVVRRAPSSDSRLFVAEATSERAETVLTNYREGHVAEDPELGALVEPAGFAGLEPLVASRTLARLAKGGLQAQRLGDLCAKIERCGSDWSEVELDRNTLFLRTVNPVASVSKPDRGQPRHWVRLAVDDDRTTPQALSRYFEGRLGRLSLETFSIGMTTTRIRFDDIPEVPIFLPSFDDQVRIVELDQLLRLQIEEMESLRSALWRRPEQHKQLQADIEKLVGEDSLVAWFDTLPFPLASILWRWRTTQDKPVQGYQLLDHFFEALAQFMALLLLSIVRRDERLFPREMRSIHSTLSRQNLSLGRASMGTWSVVYSRLAKTLRSLVHENPESAVRWQRLAACEDLGLFKALVGKPLVTLIQEANALRNEWRGHGGLVGEKVATSRQREYIEMLLRFQKLVGRRWQSYPMLMPEAAKWTGEYHVTTALQIVGTRTPFERTTIELKEPMLEGQLHVGSRELTTTCELLPLMTLGPSPPDQKSACYFYNRIDGEEEQRFVSYHFVERPEVTNSSPEVRAALVELSAPDAGPVLHAASE